MSILILGAKGNLGRQLIKVFNKNYRVIAWDKEDIDIANKNLIFNKIQKLKPDVIINATGYNAVDNCDKEKKAYKLAKRINCDAIAYLAEIALKIDALIVHYSSDYVFSGNNKKGYNENSQPSPINKYGKTKFLGEKELIKRSQDGLKWYLIRTSKLFGPGGKSKLSKPSFFDILIKLSNQKKEIDVVDEEVSCFTYTHDLAKATKELIESDSQYGIYHIINNGACTWYEAAIELFRIAGINIKINPVSSNKFTRLAKRPKYSVLLNTKLKPMRDWRKALEEYLRK